MLEAEMWHSALMHGPPSRNYRQRHFEQLAMLHNKLGTGNIRPAITVRQQGKLSPTRCDGYTPQRIVCCLLHLVQVHLFATFKWRWPVACHIQPTGDTVTERDDRSFQMTFCSLYNSWFAALTLFIFCCSTPSLVLKSRVVSLYFSSKETHALYTVKTFGKTFLSLLLKYLQSSTLSRGFSPNLLRSAKSRQSWRGQAHPWLGLRRDPVFPFNVKWIHLFLEWLFSTARSIIIEIVIWTFFKIFTPTSTYPTSPHFLEHLLLFDVRALRATFVETESASLLGYKFASLTMSHKCWDDLHSGCWKKPGCFEGESDLDFIEYLR